MADVPAPDYALERKNGELRIRYGRLAVPLEKLVFPLPAGSGSGWGTARRWRHPCIPYPAGSQGRKTGLMSSILSRAEAIN